MRFLKILFILLLISNFNLCFSEGNIKPLWVHEVDDVVNSVDISPDGKYIAVGCGYHRSGIRNGWVYLFDSNGNVLWKYKTKDSVRCVKFGGDYIAVASWGGLYLFDKSGSLLWNKSYHVWTVDISNDGEYIVTRCEKVLFFDKNGNLLWKYDGIEGWFSALDMTPDAKYIVVGDHEGNIYYFDNKGNLLWKRNIKEFDEKNEVIDSISMSNDGKYIAIGCHKKCYLLDSTGNLLWKKKIRDGGVFVTIAPNSEYVVCSFYVFDKNGNLLWKRDISSSSDIISKDGEYITTACGYTLARYDKSGNLLWIYNVEGYIYGLSTTPDGKYVVAGDDENKVYFFDATQYKKEEFLGTNSAILSVTSKPKGEVYVNGTYYGTTPIDIKLKPGKYTVDVYKEGYATFTEDIEIQGGEKYNIYAVLEKRTKNPTLTL